MTITFSDDGYAYFCAHVTDTGNFFIFNESFLKVMSVEAAVAMQKMTNLYTYLLKNKQITGRWFYFTVEDWEEHLNMKRDCQTRVLRELQGYDRQGNLNTERAFISTSKQGVPAKRHIKINYHTLNIALGLHTLSVDGECRQLDNGVSRSLDNEKARQLNDGKPRQLSKRTNEKEKLKEQTVVAARTTTSSSLQHLDGSVEKESDALMLAKRLHRLILSKNKVMREVKNIHTWVKPFAELLDKCPLARIEKVLSWYEKHIGENKWIPKAYSAETFLVKFVRLEEIMKELVEEDNSDYGTSDNPIPFKIIVFTGKSYVYKDNPDLDWNQINTISNKRKCDPSELSSCYLVISPLSDGDNVTIAHRHELPALMKKKGWKYP